MGWWVQWPLLIWGLLLIVHAVLKKRSLAGAIVAAWAIFYTNNSLFSPFHVFFTLGVYTELEPLPFGPSPKEGGGCPFPLGKGNGG